MCKYQKDYVSLHRENIPHHKGNGKITKSVKKCKYLMKMDKKDLNDVKTLIRRLQKHGDVKAACVALGCHPQTFTSAMNRTDDRFTDMELMMLDYVYNKVLKRLELRKKVGLN